MDQLYDVAVIGGGINGCGAAADAASAVFPSFYLKKTI